MARDPESDLNSYSQKNLSSGFTHPLFTVLVFPRQSWKEHIFLTSKATFLCLGEEEQDKGVTESLGCGKARLRPEGSWHYGPHRGAGRPAECQKPGFVRPEC